MIKGDSVERNQLKKIWRGKLSIWLIGNKFSMEKNINTFHPHQSSILISYNHHQALEFLFTNYVFSRLFMVPRSHAPISKSLRNSPSSVSYLHSLQPLLELGFLVLQFQWHFQESIQNSHEQLCFVLRFVEKKIASTRDSPYVIRDSLRNVAQ